MTTKIRNDQLDTGTAAGKIVELEAGSPAGPGKLPAVDGSNLIGVSGGGGGLFTEDSDFNIFGGTGAGAALVASITQRNFFAGINAGNAMSSGDDNIFIGHHTGQTSTNGSDNVVIGSYAGDALTNSDRNVLIGTNAGTNMYGNADSNVCIGNDAGGTATIAAQNVLIGLNAGRLIQQGDNNVAVGTGAGFDIVNGNSNICIGLNAGPDVDTSNKLFIDNVKTDTPLLGGDFSTEVITINGDLVVTGNVVGHLDINAQTGTVYTLVLDDDGKLITMDNASANTLKIPTDADVNFPIGTQILVSQEGAGTTTIESAGAGSPAAGSPATAPVTIHSANDLRDISTQYSTITLIKKATDTWLLVGDLA